MKSKYWKILRVISTLLGLVPLMAGLPLKSIQAQSPSLPPSGIVTSTPGPVSPDIVPTTCSATFVVEMTEGPYYKTGSPERTDLVEADTTGVPFTLTGYVFDKNCSPVAGAWIDFWQCDGVGDYDNVGYKLRGHQFTDAQGKYTLHTVFPGQYPGRANHIHVKLSRAENSGNIVTSQLFFPGVNLNTTDDIFSSSMVVVLGQSGDGQYIAFFNFKIEQ